MKQRLDVGRSGGSVNKSVSTFWSFETFCPFPHFCVCMMFAYLFVAYKIMATYFFLRLLCVGVRQLFWGVFLHSVCLRAHVCVCTCVRACVYASARAATKLNWFCPI